jgi:glycosyltransferase involved in cell wall biosynthesis
VSDLAILVPVLARPQNVRPLLKSIRVATPDATVLFICDPDDTDEIVEVNEAGGEVLLVAGNYAAKINRGVEATSEPLLFLGADDLRFRPGWLEAAKAHIGRAEVVGINDLIPRERDHTTHFLVTRDYAERQGTIDGPGLLSEAYEHNFVDDELIATATHRGVYAYAEDAHVEHLHPMVRSAPLDETYKRGMGAIRRDRRRFVERESLWT